ncbi:hypothetical protein V5799_004332 [Amblyomma americanum]|uniref:Uncharacterized protein n=1 Tax=Amblyomma americanum TaxID=6943 RepID=A0AAQ4D6E6_AMBAM
MASEESATVLVVATELRRESLLEATRPDSRRELQVTLRDPERTPGEQPKRTFRLTTTKRATATTLASPPATPRLSAPANSKDRRDTLAERLDTRLDSARLHMELPAASVASASASTAKDTTD